MDLIEVLALYGLDARVEGMVYAARQRPPVLENLRRQGAVEDRRFASDDSDRLVLTLASAHNCQP